MNLLRLILRKNSSGLREKQSTSFHMIIKLDVKTFRLRVHVSFY